MSDDYKVVGGTTSLKQLVWDRFCASEDNRLFNTFVNALKLDLITPDLVDAKRNASRHLDGTAHVMMNYDKVSDSEFDRFEHELCIGSAERYVDLINLQFSVPPLREHQSYFLDVSASKTLELRGHHNDINLRSIEGDFVGMCLRDCRLHGVYDHSMFYKPIINENSRITDFKMTDGNVSEGEFTDTEFENVDFKDSRFYGCTFKDCHFTNCNFPKTRFKSCSFDHCTFEGVDMKDTEFTFQCEFVNGCNMEGIKNLETASFEDNFHIDSDCSLDPAMALRMRRFMPDDAPDNPLQASVEDTRVSHVTNVTPLREQGGDTGMTRGGEQPARDPTNPFPANVVRFPPRDKPEGDGGAS